MRRAQLAAAILVALTFALGGTAHARGHGGGGHGMGGAHFGGPGGGHFSGGHFGGPHFRGVPGHGPFVHTPFVHRPFIHRRFFVAAAPFFVPGFAGPYLYGAAPYAPAYWYYCPEFGAYYPYVTQCPGPWAIVR